MSNDISTGFPDIADDDLAVLRFKAVLKLAREARAINDPVRQQQLRRLALGQVTELTAREFSDLFAADNAAAAIGRSLFELEASAPIGGETSDAAPTEFSTETLRDNPSLRITALLIVANHINRTSAQLPPGLAITYATTVFLHCMGEATWLSQHVRPDGGKRHHQNLVLIGLVYYEQGFSGLSSLAAAAVEVEKRFPLLQVNWENLEKARTRDTANRGASPHAGFHAAAQLCLKEGRKHRAMGQPYRPLLLNPIFVERLMNAAVHTRHKGRLPLQRLLDLLNDA
jgi:hypothetical protein